MTISQLIECVLGKNCTLDGYDADLTAFTGINTESVAEILEKNGMEKYGKQILYNGKTGQQIVADIFIGPTFYYRLKHLVSDKQHCLTKDHDVLTNDGWKSIKYITINDEVATLVNGKIKYQKPLKTYKYENYHGEMYEIRSGKVDLHVTANHRMWVSINNEPFQFIEARYVHNLCNDGKTVKYLNMKGEITLKIDDIQKESLYNYGKLFNNNGITVYCLEVKGGIFYVRRNGCEVWTGNSRSTGPYQLLTKQPAEGRSRGGGLRMGEMERDCMLAHGCPYFLKERMYDCSDKYLVYICKDCGMIAEANPGKNIFRCRYCDNQTRFAKALIPYASKLLSQELHSMNIVPRFITSGN